MWDCNRNQWLISHSFMMKQSWIIAIICMIFAGLAESRNDDLIIPPNLLMGAGTSAYQVEGAWNLSGKGENIWDRMVHTHPETILDRSNGDVACDSYHKYKEDVQLMKSIGIQVYRFSISCARVIKPGCANEINEPGLNYYKNLVTELVKNDIQPIVTIYHWDHSQYLEDMGGWLNEMMIDHYVTYARILFKELGDKVKIWQTINEPNTFCQGAYGGKSALHLAPAKPLNRTGIYLCMHNLLKAHALVYHMYDKEFRPTQHGVVGIGPNCGYYRGVDPNDTVSVETALQFECGWVNHPIYHGDYPKIMKERLAMISKAEGCEKSVLPEFSEKWIERIRGTADYFGVNHYMTSLVAPDPDEKRGIHNSDSGLIDRFDPNRPQSTASWLYVIDNDVPEGFGELLRWIKKEYNNPPVRVTENGWADDGDLNDYGRIRYHRGYVKSMLKAVKEDHCDVRSYSIWSLLDDFEWDSGYTQKFGIIGVDFNDPKRTRREKLSTAWWRKVLATRKLQPVPSRGTGRSRVNQTSSIGFT